jgi:hypothetical protein
VQDLLINLLASVVAGTVVWLTQRVLRYRRIARRRAFFGLDEDADCVLTVSRHASSTHEHSVHRTDVAALVELATIAKECGARADLPPESRLRQGLGRVTEFCVGGPFGNARTAAHLRAIVPGVRFHKGDDQLLDLPFSVGTVEFRREAGAVEYGVLCRAWGPDGGRPVFILGGQTARANLAAARFLAHRYRQLHREYGASKRFCVVLRIVEPAVYGPDFTEIAADLSDEAFTKPPPAGTASPEATVTPP